MTLIPRPAPLTAGRLFVAALVQVLVVMAFVLYLLALAWQTVPAPCHVEVAPQTYAGPCVEDGGPWSWLLGVLR